MQISAQTLKIVRQDDGKGERVSCRLVEFPPPLISNEDSRSSLIHQTPCMKLSILMPRVVDLFHPVRDNLFICLFIVHQCEANFFVCSNTPFPSFFFFFFQLKLHNPFMVSGAGLSVACDSLSAGTPQLHLAQLDVKQRFISLCALWL